MENYKLTAQGGCVIRQSDGYCIPFADGNTNYEQLLEWLAAGNTMIPADPPPPPSQDELDVQAVKADVKLMGLTGMSPAQLKTHFANNVTTQASKDDVLLRLAIAVSILARRLK